MSENKHTLTDLKQMQSLPLEAKIRMTENRIKWFVDKYDAVISFSGGKDSTVLLDICRRIYPDMPAVFADTGLEYPEIREFVKTKDNVIWVKPEMYKRNVFGERINPKTQKAYKFMGLSKLGMKVFESNIPISHHCCEIMKKRPIDKINRELNVFPITATMACESKVRQGRWLKNGCNIYEGKSIKSQPMSFWTEQDVLQYLKEYNIPYASVYGDIVEDENGKLHTTGCQRTGCVFCGFGCHLEKEPNRFQRLKQTHPKLWDYCMRDWDKGGLGMAEVLNFMGVKTE